MPLIKIEQVAHAVLGVWEATETEDFFLRNIPDTYMEGYEPQRFSARRRKEFLASRWLLKKIVQDDALRIVADASGKLKDAAGKWHFSLSHSGNRVAAVASAAHTVGVDIEEIHPRILKVMHKFLNEQEKQALGATPELWRVTLCWSAKESIFKMIEEPGISFSAGMQLTLPLTECGNFSAVVKRGNHEMPVIIRFEKTDDYILTYCIAP